MISYKLQHAVFRYASCLCANSDREPQVHPQVASNRSDGLVLPICLSDIKQPQVAIIIHPEKKCLSHNYNQTSNDSVPFSFHQVKRVQKDIKLHKYVTVDYVCCLATHAPRKDTHLLQSNTLADHTASAVNEKM